MSTQKTLLLVEPDQAHRLRLGTAIVRRRWRLRTARDDGEALDALHFFAPDVIIIDLDSMHAPDEVVGKMREREPGAKATIVAISRLEHDARQLQVDAVVTRPFSFQTLFDTIEHTKPPQPD